MNLKFMSMAAMVAMAMFTACSEDDNTPNPNPEPEPNPNPDVTVEGYSSDLFVAEANHNVIEYDFSNTFKDGFIGTIDGGADMPKVNEFLKRQHIVVLYRLIITGQRDGFVQAATAMKQVQTQ